MVTYEQVIESILALMPTSADLWLGMAPDSKTGAGNPVAVRDLRHPRRTRRIGTDLSMTVFTATHVEHSV